MLLVETAKAKPPIVDKLLMKHTKKLFIIELKNPPISAHLQCFFLLQLLTQFPLLLSSSTAKEAVEAV